MGTAGTHSKRNIGIDTPYTPVIHIRTPVERHLNPGSAIPYRRSAGVAQAEKRFFRLPGYIHQSIDFVDVFYCTS